MKRRAFISLLGGAAIVWPLAARAQQAAMPIVGLVNGRSAQDGVRNVAAFRSGLNETGYVESQNVMVEYHWLEGQYSRLPSLMDDLVRRPVAVIATPTFRAGAQAAKAATSFPASGECQHQDNDEPASLHDWSCRWVVDEITAQ
jgi:putative ABC transport system substrate-binding protein